MSILCRMGHHRPSRRSELDLTDLHVKSYCKRCGVPLVHTGRRWEVAAPEHADAA